MPTANGHTAAIRATRVIGTPVKDATGHRIGDVEDVMLDKLSNGIMFGILSFGGVLGIGEKYHPVPWSMLRYDEQDGNYVVDLSEDQLKSAPAYSIEELSKSDGISFRDAAFDFYKAPRYW